jgi:predicted ATP-binding protein involved in virulence
MRIDRLHIENFKKFQRTEQPFELHKQFTLLVGDNGSGKTSVLDALAVALGLWHKAAPGSGWRNILPEEVWLNPVPAGDRVQFKPQLPSLIRVEGQIGSHQQLSWTRMIREGGTRTTNAEARQAEAAIIETVQAAEAQQAPLPVLAYYGAGRAWLPTNKRPTLRTSQRKPQQFDAYRKCLDTRIRDQDLNEWFLFETAAANGHGEGRPGYRAVKRAVLQCIPEADGLRYDSDLKEIVLSIRGFEQPYYNLSAGQRMMLAMVADIAIKAVTLNSYLLGPDHPGASDPMHVLRQSPGVVLIDELDVHLHPIWQRRVATDLKRTFEKIQFVCTSHSPQVIGEVRPEEVRLLRGEHAEKPAQSFGMDSNWVVEVLMEGAERNPTIKGRLENIFRLVEQKDLPAAEEEITKLRSETGNSDRLQRAASLVERIKVLGK